MDDRTNTDNRAPADNRAIRHVVDLLRLWLEGYDAPNMIEQELKLERAADITRDILGYATEEATH